MRRTFGCARLVWNRTLAARHEAWHQRGESTSYRQADAALTMMKRQPDLAFLREVSSVPLQQCLRHQQRAFDAFFAGRARYPRFRARGRGRQSATYTRSAFRYRADASGEHRLTLAKQDAPLRFVWSWPDIDPAALDPTTVTVTEGVDGRWFATLHVDHADPDPLPSTGEAVGVDVGVKHLAVLSTGERIDHHAGLLAKERRRRRYAKRMSRRRPKPGQPASNRYRKAGRQAARAASRMRDARRDHLHKVTTRLVNEHDVIAVENLHVKGMARGGGSRKRGLNRALANASFGEFRGMLAYKAERAGRRLLACDRWYPSSKTCSACGHLLGHLDLGVRAWACPSCGARHDRDVNAAKNILAFALAEHGHDVPGADPAAGRAVAARGGTVRRGRHQPTVQSPRSANQPAAPS